MVDKTNKIRTANILLVSFLVICFFKMFFCYTFFNVNESFILALTAVMAVFAFLLVLTIFNRLNIFIQMAWIMLVIFLPLSYLRHLSGLEYICNTIIFLGLLTALPYTNLKFSNVKTSILLFTLYCIFVILFASKFEGDSSSLIDLNTNTSGILLFILEFCFVSYATVCNRNKKLLCYILLLLTFVSQLSFGSRSSLIGTALLVVYALFGKFFNHFKKKQVRNLVVLICVLSVVFAYFYSVTLFNKIGHGNVYLFGKDIFTGRQKIWADAFAQLNGNWLFGIGNSLDSYMGEGTNLHNQMMGFLVCFGVLVAVTFIVLVSLLISRLFTRNANNFCVAFLITLLVMSYFETNLYASVNMFYIPIAIVIIHFCDLNTVKR